ncbi:MAG: STAS/SEC14 domain-containing protein [Planctomycetota bacterium]|nr:MAG: STAS/SEC14 domain-containing protein [Planctomycetota bacterium]
MAIKFHEVALEADSSTNVVRVHVTGKLTKEDYELFVPQVERRIKQHGKIRILFEMEDFHGWTAGALWEDIKFDLKHFKDIEKIAMVGEKAWERGMAVFCRPFTTAKIRYFDRSEADEALKRLLNDGTASSQ